MSHPHAPDLDPLAILNALGIARPGAVEPVTGGADTDLWRVTHGGATYALRVFRLGEQENAAREAVVMQAMWAGGLPVPEIVEQAEWSDRPVHLLTWCSGMTVAASIRRRVWEARHLGRSSGRFRLRFIAFPCPLSCAILGIRGFGGAASPPISASR